MVAWGVLAVLAPTRDHDELTAVDERTRRWDVVAIVAIVIGAAARELFGVVTHPAMDYVYSDMAGYVDRAVRVVEGADLNRFDALLPPGTHLLLAVPLWLFGTDRTGLVVGSMVWAALSAATPFFAWRVARHLLSPAAAAIAAVLVAASPLAIAYTGYFTSETPATALLVAVVLLALTCRTSTGRRRLLAGVALGVAAGALLGVRPQLALNGLFAVAPLLIRWRTYRTALAGAVVAGGVLLAPTLAANAAAGAAGRINTHEGINFFLAHCDVRLLSTGLDATTGRWDVASPVAIQRDRGYDEFEPDHPPWDSDHYFRRGFDCIGDDGLGHVAVVVRNAADMTITSTPWPLVDGPVLGDVARVANVVYCAALLVALVVLAVWWRRGRLEWRGGVGILLVHLSLVLPTALLFLGEPRYRIPYDVFGWMLIAAVVAQALRLDEPNAGAFDRIATTPDEEPREEG